MVCRTVAILHYRLIVFQKHLMDGEITAARAARHGVQSLETGCGGQRESSAYARKSYSSAMGTSVSYRAIECVGSHNPGTRKRG